MGSEFRRKRLGVTYVDHRATRHICFIDRLARQLWNVQSAGGDEQMIGLIAWSESLCTNVGSSRMQVRRHRRYSSLTVVLGAVLKMGAESNEAEGVDGTMWFGI